MHSMNALDDYNNLFFEGAWDFIKATQCVQKRRVRGPSGEIKNRSPIEDEEEVSKSYNKETKENFHFFSIPQQYCESHPWLIEPGPEQYLYVKLPGTVVTNRSRCETQNRIVVHTAGTLHAAVCPRPPDDARHSVVEVFSDGWTVGDGAAAMFVAAASDAARSIAVEFIIREDEEYPVTWLELTRR